MRPELQDVETPAVVVDAAILENNLRRMAEMCAAGGAALRPHAKTHKCLEIADRQMALGAKGLTVAKLSEAEVFARGGVIDILTAYELVGPLKMKRLAAMLALQAEGRLRLSSVVDDLGQAIALSNEASAAGTVLPVLIEVDTGLGRTGVTGVEAALSLARHIRLFPGIRLEGVLTHEGQVYGGTPRERAEAAAKVMVETADAIRGIGLECPTVSMGSTPGARFLAGYPGVTEIRPGTYVFNDRTQVELGAATEEECALTVLATVVSVQPGRRAILDSGTKCLTSDGVPRFGSYGAVVGDPEVVIAGCSEEHAHVDISRSERAYAIGDRVHVLPNHVCPVVNLTDRLNMYEGGSLLAEWRVAARGCVR